MRRPNQSAPGTNSPDGLRFLNRAVGRRLFGRRIFVAASPSPSLSSDHDFKFACGPNGRRLPGDPLGFGGNHTLQLEPSLWLAASRAFLEFRLGGDFGNALGFGYFFFHRSGDRFCQQSSAAAAQHRDIRVLSSDHNFKFACGPNGDRLPGNPRGFGGNHTLQLEPSLWLSSRGAFLEFHLGRDFGNAVGFGYFFFHSSGDGFCQQSSAAGAQHRDIRVQCTSEYRDRFAGRRPGGAIIFCHFAGDRWNAQL